MMSRRTARARACNSAREGWLVAGTVAPSGEGGTGGAGPATPVSVGSGRDGGQEGGASEGRGRAGVWGGGRGGGVGGSPAGLRVARRRAESRTGEHGPKGDGGDPTELHRVDPRNRRMGAGLEAATACPTFGDFATTV